MTSMEKKLTQELGFALATALRRIAELETEIVRLQAEINRFANGQENVDEEVQADQLYIKLVDLCNGSSRTWKIDDGNWLDEDNNSDCQSPDTSIVELSDKSSLDSSLGHISLEDSESEEESNNIEPNGEIASVEIN